MRKPPRAKLVGQTANESIWRVQWARGNTYFARVSADGERLVIETAAKRLPASDLVTIRLSPAIREAIAVAKTQMR